MQNGIASGMSFTSFMSLTDEVALVAHASVLATARWADQFVVTDALRAEGRFSMRRVNNGDESWVSITDTADGRVYIVDSCVQDELVELTRSR